MIPLLPPTRAEIATDPGAVDGDSGPVRPLPRRISARHIGIGAGLALLTLLVSATMWAMWIAPPWGPMQPPERPTFTFLSANGVPIARRGGMRDAAVDAGKLPLQVRGAFIAIEDRRFRSHFGVDLRGLGRAMWHNLRAGGVVEGGSTITQQLAKTAFLTSDRKIGRKVQELILAVWLDAWLSKDEILSRYLSSIYFGDGVYGLRAATRHYFNKEPETLSVAEAAMLAGMVKAPSRLSPTNDLPAAQARSMLVLRAMTEEGMLSPAALAKIRPATLNPPPNELPAGSYFVDWIAPEAGHAAPDAHGQVTIRTTLDDNLQRAAITALTSILAREGRGLHATQAALVAMRPDGQVVAMVGGRSYGGSPFNRVTQASRQPGSAFKLAVYLAALDHGSTPETLVEDTPLTIGGWSPRNYGHQYGPPLTLRDAFAHSSNVAAVRVAERVGRPAVADTARRLGIASKIVTGPSMALGTSGTTLLELTAAYAGIASGHYPVKPRGLDAGGQDPSASTLDPNTREAMLDLLWTATNMGTGRAAALDIPTFGKTGTTQNHRDAVFVGFAGGLVTGVWVGNDDNSPMRGVTGGSLPARIWHDFMRQANLRADDLALPPILLASIAERQEAMRAAAETRAAEEGGPDNEDEMAAPEPESALQRFFEPFIPKFLRPRREEQPSRDEQRWQQREYERRMRGSEDSDSDERDDRYYNDR
jgi:penicillin-binding protein 1A